MDAGKRRVGEIMTKDVAVLAPNERLDLADDIMKLGRVRHLPVVDNKKLVGILSARDLLAASLTRSLEFDAGHRRSFLRAVDVSEVMSRSVDVVRPETTAREAAKLMTQRKIGCLPVVNAEGELVGLLTETDLVRAAYLEASPAPSHDA